jgi:hypothetical protein
MKPWHWALLGIGTVAGVVVIAKVISSQSAESPMPGSAASLPASNAPVETGAAIATGAFNLAQGIASGLFERERRHDEENRRILGGKSDLTDASDPNYNATAALALKQGRA